MSIKSRLKNLIHELSLETYKKVSPDSFPLRWSVLILPVILSHAGQVLAGSITLEISALIDGRDRLIIQGDTLQWHHFDFAAVGRHSGRNEPTIIRTTLNGTLVMDHVNWIPDWPLPLPDEIRVETFSSVFTGLTPAIPSQDISVTLQVINARSILQLVQLPTANNSFTTILEFDDNVLGGSAQYDGLLTFTTAQPVAEPSTSSLVGLLGLSGVSVLVYRTWQRQRSKKSGSDSNLEGDRIAS